MPIQPKSKAKAEPVADDVEKGKAKATKPKAKSPKASASDVSQQASLSDCNAQAKRTADAARKAQQRLDSALDKVKKDLAK